MIDAVNLLDLDLLSSHMFKEVMILGSIIRVRGRSFSLGSRRISTDGVRGFSLAFDDVIIIWWNDVGREASRSLQGRIDSAQEGTEGNESMEAASFVILTAGLTQGTRHQQSNESCSVVPHAENGA